MFQKENDDTVRVVLIFYDKEKNSRKDQMYVYIYLYFYYCLSSHQKSKWFWYTREQPWWFIIVWHHSNVKHLISQDIRRATSIRYLKWMDINSFITTSCNITTKCQ